MSSKNNKQRFYITDELYSRVNDLPFSEPWVMLFSDIRRNWWMYLAIISILIVAPCLLSSYNKHLLKENQATIAALIIELDEVKRDDLIHTIIGRYVTEGHKTPLSDSAVYNLCVECGAPFPELIVAQYKLESATGTSPLSLNANNLVGMKVVTGKRPTTQIKGKDWNGYGMYHNWQSCIIDRVLLENWVFKGREFPNETEYRKWISGRYAEDENYMQKVDSIIKNLKENIS